MPRSPAPPGAIRDGFGTGNTFNDSASRGITTPFVFPRTGNTIDTDQAHAFTVPDSSDFVLTSIEMPLEHAIGRQNILDIWLLGHDPNAGDYGAPDASKVLAYQRFVDLATPYRPGPLLPSDVVEFSFDSSPRLAAGGVYWLVLSTPELDNYIHWWAAPLDLGPRPGLWAERYDGGSWEVANSERWPGLAFRVNAVAVPLPAAAWLGLVLMAVMTRSTRRRCAHGESH